MSNTSFPDSAVVYILDDFPGLGEFQATGVIIGPHTVLTAAHVLYDADTETAADAISLYPGYTPDSTVRNPPGALGGVQTIHYVKVPDNDHALSSAATQADFAVIDTSADLTPYGSFALDPDFSRGDVVVKGYPSSANGLLSGIEATLSQDGRLSDIATRGIGLSPGFSGGPLYDTVERNGSIVDAVVGTVSTTVDAMKLTRAKVALIRRWIAIDRSVDAGGLVRPNRTIPQLAGTVSSSVDPSARPAPSDAALATAVQAIFTYAPHAADAEWQGSASAAMAPGPSLFTDFIDALRMPSALDAAVAAHPTQAAMGIVAPAQASDHRHTLVSGA